MRVTVSVPDWAHLPTYAPLVLLGTGVAVATAMLSFVLLALAVRAWRD